MACRCRTTICRDAWYHLLVFALILAGALIRDVNLLLVLAGMVAGPVLFSWPLLAVTLRGLKVRRSVPRGVCAGDLLVGSIRLSNTRRRVGSWAVMVEEQVRRESPAGDHKPLRPGVLFPYVPAGQSRKGSYRGRLTRRGRYRLGPLRISTRFPFGLFHRTITAGEIHTLIVLPRLGRLTRQWAARRREDFSETSRRERRPGPEGDFYGLREWRKGDSRRWIHARTSARVGQPVVRQFEQPRNREVAVLLDLWQPEHPKPEDLEHVETAVSFAATVIADLCRRGGSNLHLATEAAEPCLHGPASAALLQDAMRRLATVEARDEDRLAELLVRACGEIGPATEIVLVSTRPVDVGDKSRFRSLQSDSARAGLARRIHCVDASSDQLTRYFQRE